MDRVLKIINILLLSIVGMLLLTGVIVFVHGSKVDFKAADLWAALSAVATVGTFAVAWFAFKSVPDWLAPKLKDKQFKFADELIEDFCTLQHYQLELLTKFLTYINNVNFTDIQFKKVTIEAEDELNKYIGMIIHLKAKMGRMELWGLKPKNMTIFVELIDSHHKLFKNFMNTHESKRSDPKNNLLNDIENLLTINKTINENHGLIIKPYNELFEK